MKKIASTKLGKIIHADSKNYLLRDIKDDSVDLKSHPYCIGLNLIV